MNEAQRAAEQAARLSYGRLVALLTSRFGSPHRAEDALSDAFTRALETWPIDGVPERPEAWLFRVARNALVDTLRGDRRHAEHTADITALSAQFADQQCVTDAMNEGFPDERLKLMFLCTHPAIDPKVRAPLMLQLVLGLDVARMAPVFLLAPGTLGQRLTRAKSKIETAGISLSEPSVDAFQTRLDDVLSAIYAAYTVGYEGVATHDTKAANLATEALWLISLVCKLRPSAAEAHGLFALMLYAEARRPARLDHAGAWVSLAEQDASRWDAAMLADADKALAQARRHLTIGRFQLEAAIQAAHCARRSGGPTDWSQILQLHDGLVAVSPTVGAQTSRAVAVGQAHGAAAGLEALDAISAQRRADYQPWWAARAHFLDAAGQSELASQAFYRAAGLCSDPAVRRYLLSRQDRLKQAPVAAAR